MKVYTGFGDQGNTSLYDLTVVKKNSIRVEAYGTVDELSAFLGQARFLSSDYAECNNRKLPRFRLRK